MLVRSENGKPRTFTSFNNNKKNEKSKKATNNDKPCDHV